jgi:transposase
MVNQLKMADTQTILALHSKGWSARRIARELKMDRQTVGRYIRLGREADSKPANAPSGSGGSDQAGADSKPSEVSSGFHNSHAGTGAVNSPTASACTAGSQAGVGPGRRSAAAPWRDVIWEKLQQGLEAQRIYQDLTAPEYGYRGTYYSVRRLAARLSEHRELPVRRMHSAPGMEAQVDFGRGAWLVDAAGHRRGTWVFRIVLSHSRKGYSEAVLRQTTDDFLRCIENAFFEFGGVPQTLVIDNLRAAVSRADWFDPELCPKARSFAEHYRVAILPTKPYTPRHKGKIENGINYVKNNALKARIFSTLAEENRHLRQWEQTVADTRIHGTMRQQVLGVFTTVEKPALQPLAAGRFDLFEEALRSVHRDGHVQVKGAYYSVGPEYMGQSVWARWDGRMVRIFDQRMNAIAAHAQLPPGQFSTHNAHIAPEKISRIEHGTHWLLGQVEVLGPEAKRWAENMLQARGIQGVRVLMGLLSLKHYFTLGAINEACRAALEHGEYHLRSLRRMAAQRQAGEPLPHQGHLGFIEDHEIIRPVAEYQKFVHDALTGQASAMDTPYKEKV